jgi:hypothetical protein
MSIATASLSDALPTSVPKLESNGTNWAIFLVRFRDAVDAKGFWGHFDGTTPVPSLSTTPTAAETAAKSQWEKDERSAKSLLTQKLPDSTLMRIHMKVTVEERWKAVVKEYTEKGAYAQTDMRAKFLASRCPEKGNVRDFLEELRTKREELVQVGVDIDAKDYLSTIISSLPISLSSFASAQLAAARMFSPTKSIEPDVLLSLLMEEADRMMAQLARHRVSKKGKEEEPNEALSAGTSTSKPRKGKGRENVKCWNCDIMGHYSTECKEPKKTDEKAKDVATKKPGTSASAVEPDAECEGAWAAVLVEDAIEEGPGPALPISEKDWFEEVVAMMDVEKCDVVPIGVKIPVWNCFDEFTEGDDESEDVGASSGDVSVDGFDSDAFEGTNPGDLGITGHFWPVCDDFEGADKLLGADLGPCQDLAQVAPVVHPEGEFRGDGITSESSGRLPDLGVDENPWIDATMEWRIHAIVLRASVEVVTCLLGGPKGKEVDTDVQVHGSCDVGVIELMRESEGPREVGAVCGKHPLVPRFEGEEDIRVETMDLPIAHDSSAPIESLTAEIFDLDDCASVASASEGLVKFPEGQETFYDASTTQIVVENRQNASNTHISLLNLFLVVWSCEKCQKVAEGVYGSGGLTLGVGHLVRPPGYVFERRWMKDNALSSWLIAIVDACHMWDASGDVSIFGALGAGEVVSV